MLAFTASKGTDKVLLNFSTTNETSLTSFGIERSSDGSTFSKIGTVPAAGTNGTHNYTFTDGQPLPAQSYYRLAMVNSNGSYTYSNIVAIRYDKNTFMTIFPNPAKDMVNVQLQLPAGPVSLQVIDMMGHTVKSVRLQSAGGALSTAIDISALARGQYYIRAGSERLSFIKQ